MSNHELKLHWSIYPQECGCSCWCSVAVLVDIESSKGPCWWLSCLLPGSIGNIKNKPQEVWIMVRYTRISSVWYVLKSLCFNQIHNLSLSLFLSLLSPPSFSLALFSCNWCFWRNWAWLCSWGSCKSIINLFSLGSTICLHVNTTYVLI